MRIERGDIFLEYDEREDEVTIGCVRNAHEGVVLDRRAALWLQIAGLPTMLANVPSDRPEKVDGPEPTAGQIPGQLAIE